MLLPKPTLDDVQKLKALIADSSNQEKSCQGFLEFVAARLALVSGDFVQMKREGRSSRGDWDFAVTVRVPAGTRTGTQTFIWEAKSLQKRMFRYDNASRLMPSVDFVQAETQLLYYCHVCQYDPGFRTSLGMDDTEKLNPGGIIISRFLDPVEWRGESLNLLSDEKQRLIEEAYLVRRTLLYSAAKIDVYYWDTVVEWMEKEVAGYDVIR